MVGAGMGICSVHRGVTAWVLKHGNGCGGSRDVVGCAMASAGEVALLSNAVATHKSITQWYLGVGLGQVRAQ